jgi:aminopeptidase N
MRAILLLSAALLLQPQPTPSPAVDEYPRRIGIDVENYRFELALSDTDDRIDGRAVISLRFTEDGVSELPLDLTSPRDDGLGMTVRSASANDSALEYEHEGDLLNIRLHEPGQSGAVLDVVVEYVGIPASGLRIGPNKYGDRTFFSDNWPNRARDWLPTIDHPYDKAANEFVVTAPSHYQVVSNGLRVEETDVGDGMRLTHWRQSAPIATWLYVLGVARFAVETVDYFDGKPIQTWVYPQDRDAGFDDFATPTKHVMEFYSDYVGPFAYEKVANITSPATGGGMEAATAIMYGEDLVTGAGESNVRLRNVVIHEIAHQWFGNAVTEADWDDVWLSEGFATYFTLLFIEHAYGRDEFVAGLKNASARVFRQYADDPGYQIVHDDLQDMRRVTSGATYQKGAWILHMLRSQMGDDAFWSGIQSYYARYFNSNATTADFRREMEAASGLDLELFFQQWLRSGGNPHLEGSWAYDSESGSVVVDLRQVHDVGPTFDMPFDIQVRFDDGRDPLVESVRIDEQSEQFVLPVEGLPSDVHLDPNTRTLFMADFGPASD